MNSANFFNDLVEKFAHGSPTLPNLQFKAVGMIPNSPGLVDAIGRNR
jgi:hypothetical protein